MNYWIRNGFDIFSARFSIRAVHVTCLSSFWSELSICWVAKSHFWIKFPIKDLLDSWLASASISPGIFQFSVMARLHQWSTRRSSILKKFTRFKTSFIVLRLFGWFKSSLDGRWLPMRQPVLLFYHGPLGSSNDSSKSKDDDVACTSTSMIGA